MPELRGHFLTQLVDFAIVGILQLVDQHILACAPFQSFLLELVGQFLDYLRTVLFLPAQLLSSFLLPSRHVFLHLPLQFLQGQSLIAFLFLLRPHHVLHEFDVLQLHLVVAGVEVGDDDLQAVCFFPVGLFD